MPMRGIAPTAWQASTHPAASARACIEVIFDGVDYRPADARIRRRVSPCRPGGCLSAGDEVLTFVNRNLEPYRGYHIFMRALPAVLAARPNAQVVIVGGDEVSYGRPPKDGGHLEETAFWTR